MPSSSCIIFLFFSSRIRQMASSSFCMVFSSFGLHQRACFGTQSSAFPFFEISDEMSYNAAVMALSLSEFCLQLSLYLLFYFLYNFPIILLLLLVSVFLLFFMLLHIILIRIEPLII